jgi:hypothetical protein
MPDRVAHARHRAGRAPLRRRLSADLLWPLAALAVVGLVGARTLRGTPLPDDGALTAPAFALLRGEPTGALLSPDGLGAVHTAVYATVTRAFERYPTLTAAGRELLLVLLLAGSVLVWRIARRLGLGSPAAAVAVLAYGAVPFLAPAHAVSTPATLAVPWLLLAGWLLADGPPSLPAAVPAAVAGLLGVLLAPDVLLLLAIGLAAAAASGRPARWTGQQRRPAAVALAVVAVAVRLLVARWSPQPDDPGRWSAGQVELVLVSGVLLAVGAAAAWWLPELRAAGIAVAGTTLLAVAPPSGRLPALLICLPVAALLLATLVQRAAAPAPRQRRRPGTRPVAGAAMATAVVVAAVALGTAQRSDFGAASRSAVVGWSAAQLPAGTRLTAEPALAAELLHAGAEPGLVTSGTDAPVEAATVPAAAVLRVVRGPAPAGTAPVTVFGAGSELPPLTVVDPSPVEPSPEQVARRRGLGRALLANPETVAPAPVAELLSDGAVDPRLLALLAGLATQFGLELHSLPVVPGEEGHTLVRQAVIGAVDGVPPADDPVLADRVLGWLAAQRGPYAPHTVRLVDDGLLITHRYIPDPDGEVSRAGGR